MVFPYSRFILPILVPLAVLYALTGAWLLRGSLKRKALVAVPAARDTSRAGGWPPTSSSTAGSSS